MKIGVQFYYREVLPSGIVVCSTGPEHATQLEELQKTVFPTLADSQLLRAEHYRHHVVNQSFDDAVTEMCEIIKKSGAQ